MSRIFVASLAIIQSKTNRFDLCNTHLTVIKSQRIEINYVSTERPKCFTGQIVHDFAHPMAPFRTVRPPS